MRFLKGFLKTSFGNAVEIVDCVDATTAEGTYLGWLQVTPLDKKQKRALRHMGYLTMDMTRYG